MKRYGEGINLRNAEMEIAVSWLREHVKGAAIYGLITLILFGIAGLYGYGASVKNMFYGVVLIAFFGICYGIWGYAGYRAKCIVLMDLAQKSGERADALFEAKTYQEKLYQDIIRVQEEEMRRIVSEYDEKKQDMADYYTMWIHQIKTPIAAMKLLLAEGDPACRELFKVEQYAQMALGYARLESLSADLLFKTQDIYTVIKQAVKKYSILFIGSGLSFNLEEFSCQAVTDEKWISLVIEQLLSNALKYTTSGGIRIRGLDRDGKETNAQAVYVVIEDDGIGIRKEDLPRIFERGFTGYNGRYDRKSTGIGLYLCRQIMERLGHTIRAESEIGVGTRVTLGFLQDSM
ncbi:MAG: sensor histidine kinase [Lachnospiraceae bacterium]|nr:sensor histidine kinase [Lachnospiraceae bacterium]